MPIDPRQGGLQNAYRAEEKAKDVRKRRPMSPWGLVIVFIILLGGMIAIFYH